MQAHFSAEQTDQRNGPGLAPSETGVGRCGARPAVPDTRCFHASSPTATELHERAKERASDERASAPPPSRPLSLVVCVYGRVSERPVRSSKACARDGGDLLRILLFLVPLVRRRLSVSLPPSPATPPAAPLPVAEKESGGHATGGGATDARWRGETERRDSGRCRGRTDGRAVAVVHYALALPRRMARYLSALAAHPLARSLSLPLHLLPMAREEQGKKTVMHAMPRNQSATASARQRFEWTPPSRRNHFPARH